MIYLDHQASAPMSARALAAMVRECQEHFANPHSEDHVPGWAASETVETARATIAAAIGGEADEVVFTSGATEADNLALLGVASAAGGGRMVVSAIEHEAVLAPARELALRGFDIAVAPVLRDGTIDPEAFDALVLPGTRLVSVMLVNNEIGTVQPIAELSAICADRGALLHVDAAQATAWMSVDAFSLGADLLSVSGHKMGGPKGIGALYVRREVRDRIRPIAFGGGQEGGLRPGTVATPLCAGLAAAFEGLPDAAEVEGWRSRTRDFAERLLATWPGSWVNGGGHPGNVSLTLPGVDADVLVARLRPALAVSRGSACASGVPSHSHVLRAIGLSATECSSTIRIGTGPATSAAELDAAAAAFERAFELAFAGTRPPALRCRSSTGAG